MIGLTLITEDSLSEVVAKKILCETMGERWVAMCLHWNKDKIASRIHEINQAAQGQVYFVLTDQDTLDRCPPTAIREMREQLHRNLLYRFAVMEVESWVMADRESLSRFLLVAKNKIQNNTDQIQNPKEYLIGLAKKSRSSKIRNEMTPGKNTTRKVGAYYNERLIDFVSNHWNVNEAIQNSSSLGRTVDRLRAFSSTV